jgi:hypothetical protein
VRKNVWKDNSLPSLGHTKASGHFDSEVVETRGSNAIEGFAEGLNGGGDDSLTTTVDSLEGAEVEDALQLRSLGGKVLGDFRDEEVRGKRHRHFL